MDNQSDRTPKMANFEYINLQRPFPGEPEINGFLLAEGTSVTLLYEFYDFNPVGFTLLRNDQITRILSRDKELFFKKIIEAEHLFSHEMNLPKISLDGFYSSLNSLREAFLIIECESTYDDNEDEFYIGKINFFTDFSIEFKTFDTLGNWDSTASEITLENITKIQFGSRYINIISKYLNNKNH